MDVVQPESGDYHPRRLTTGGIDPSITIDVKNVFYVFILVTFFNVFFIFRTFLKIKNVENLLCMQANSEISVLYLNNDRPNCSDLLLPSTIFVACWAYYMRVGI